MRATNENLVQTVRRNRQHSSFVALSVFFTNLLNKKRRKNTMLFDQERRHIHTLEFSGDRPFSGE